MHSILYSDILAAAIARLTDLIDARTAGVTVSNRKASTGARQIVLTRSPGGGTANTLRDSYVTVDVYSTDEGDCTDLMNLTLALCESRGASGMVNGDPFVYAEINGGPNDDPAADGWFKQTAELQLRHRGTDLT